MRSLLHDEIAYRTMANAVNPYGDGHAASRTVEALEQFFMGSAAIAVANAPAAASR